MSRFLACSAVAALFAAIISGDVAVAQQCRNLCNANNQVLSLQKCTDQTVSSTPMKVCCDDGNGRQNCDGNRKCRSVTINQILGCSSPGETELHCINPAESLVMSVSIEAESGAGECCSKCHCAGDPHCFAFDNKFAEWVVCESRDASRGCALTKAVCDTQLDHQGRKCIFNNGKCNQDPATPPAEMLLYKKGDVAVTLTLGPRGIIDAVLIKEGANALSLSATDCIEFPGAPWVGTPIGILSRKKFGKVWKYTIPHVKATLEVLCVAKGSLVKEPHLDVSVVDETIENGNIPPSITGFCGTGTIDYKLATTDVTNKITKEMLCGKRPVVETATYFNNGVKPKNIRKVVVTFCQKYVVADRVGRVGRCAKEVMSKKGPGWAAVYCAANTVLSREVADCMISQTCKTCISDIEDFGWDYAIQKYDIFRKKGVKPGPPCIKIADLPPNLLECQRGIRIQYQKDGVWETYKAIPHGFTLCESSGSFDSINDEVLFQHPIRFSQCGEADLPAGTCPQTGEECDSESGFKITVKTSKKFDRPELGIVELVDDGKLICNPNLYPNNPNGCFQEPLKPCPTCKGACVPSGFITPCDGNDNCGTCPDPFNQ